MDLRAGGEWRFTMHRPDGRDYENWIELLEVTPPKRVVYRHSDEGEAEPVRFHSTVTFAPLGAKTLLTTRMVFDSAAELERVEDAYGASSGLLETLARYSAYLDAKR